jgi:predicted nuclease with TOPRIM domain
LLVEDHDVITHIDELVEQEHELRQRSTAGTGISDEDRERLQRLEVQLDQCWDLLRRRRARRDMGEDPDAVPVRDPDTVEHYQQ